MKTLKLTIILLLLFVGANAQNALTLDPNGYLRIDSCKIMDDPHIGYLAMGVDDDGRYQPVKIDRYGNVITSDIILQMIAVAICILLIMVLLFQIAALKGIRMNMLIGLMLLSLCGSAQIKEPKYKSVAPTWRYLDTKPIKIGTLEVDGETGDAYLRDCYLHPDTIEARGHLTIRGPLPLNFTCSQEQSNYNERLKRNSIDTLPDNCGIPVYIVPRLPTEQDFIKWKYGGTRIPLKVIEVPGTGSFKIIDTNDPQKNTPEWYDKYGYPSIQDNRIYRIIQGWKDEMTTY